MGIHGYGVPCRLPLILSKSRAIDASVTSRDRLALAVTPHPDAPRAVVSDASLFVLHLSFPSTMPPTSAYARRNFRPRLSQDVERDTNPRPHKRQRMLSSSPDPLLDSDLDSDPLTSLPPSSAPASPSPAPKLEGLKSLPTPILLVSLPAMLSHPPNHKYYIHSLVLSLTALRKCLALPALSPDIECRAWTGLAEIGMRVISGGMSQSEDHPWAKGIETEVCPMSCMYALLPQMEFFRWRKR